MSDPERIEPVPTIEDLYDQQFDFIWRSLRHLGVPPELLDDAAQEVFVTGHRRLDSFSGRSSAWSWPFGIAIHVAQHAHRRARRRPTSESLETEVVATHRPPHDDAERSEAIHLLHELLASLELKHRAVFVLAKLEEMTASEIANALGVGVNTVYSRLRAARRDCNAALALHRARDRWRQP